MLLQRKTPSSPVTTGRSHRRRAWDIETVARRLDRMSLEEMAELKEYLSAMRRVRPLWRLRLGSRSSGGERPAGQRRGAEISSRAVFAP